MRYTAIQRTKVYKSQPQIPFPKGEPIGKGNVVYLCTPSFQESLNLLAENIIGLKDCNYTRYTTDIRFRQKIGTKTLAENQKVTFLGLFNSSKASENYTYIPLAKLELVTKRKYNLIFDIGHWNESYFKYRKKNKSPELLIEDYFQFITSKMKLDELKQYKKILLIPLTSWVKNGIPEFGIGKRYLDDPLSMLMRATYKHPELIKYFSGFDIYLVDPNSGDFYLFDAAFLIQKNYGKWKANLFKLSSVRFAGDDEGDDDEPGEPSKSSSEKKENPKAAAITKEARETTSATIKNTIIAKASKKPATPRVSKDTSAPPTIDDRPSPDLPKAPADNTENEPVVSRQDIEIEIAKEVEKTINDYDDEGLDEDIADVEDAATDAVKKNVYVAKFRPEFTTDQKRRINNLTEKQNALLTQTIPEMESKTIEPASLEGCVNTKNQTILTPRAKNFVKSYNDKKMDADIDQAVGALSQAEFPIFVIDKSVEDTSDTLNAKRTYTYKLQDYQGNKFSVKFDVPIMIDNRYIYLNGIKSIVENQLLPMPIIKSGPNEVQLITQYNKIYMHRKETDKLDTKSQVVKRYFLHPDHSADFHVKIGSCSMKNVEFDTPLDFDNIAKNISEITIGSQKFIFDLPALYAQINEFRDAKNEKPITDGYIGTALVVGYDIQTKEPILVDEKKGESITDRIIDSLSQDEQNELRKVKPGTTRYTYIQGKVLNQFIPIIFFMLFCDGLSEVLRKIGVKYEVVDPGTKFDHFNYEVIKCKDKWIIWAKYPFHCSLLLNAMYLLPTIDYTLAEMDSKTTYVEMASLFYKDARRVFALDQFKDFMIDPITREVLKDMNMPTDLTELFVVAAIMLNSNTSDSILDMKNVRIRNNEIFAQFVYKAFADAYLDYRKSIYKKKPDRLTVNRYLVTTNINGSAKTKMSGCKLIEGASSLNPVLELEKAGAVSYRGPSGINKDDGYTLQKRAYNKSMTGIIGISSSPDANVGIGRQLTLNPNITSTRGYLEAANDENLKDMKGCELFTPAELLTPQGVRHDDGNRTAMGYKQSKYSVMTEDSSPVFIGNKVEAAIPYYMSREFVITAEDNGEVIAMENNIIVIQYKNGKRDSFSLDPVQQKNSAGGFYIETQFETPLLKVGDKVKRGEVIAYNPRAFTKDTDDLSASMNIGVLCKVAIAPTYDEYEDSAPIKRSAAERLATTMVMEQSIIIGRNARVDKILQIGDHVNVGDSLAVFDDWQDDPEVASWLAELSDTLNENVSEHVATRSASEYAGEIVDVKYYSAVDLEEMSPSLKKYVKAYWNKIEQKTKVLEKYANPDDPKMYKCGQLITEKAGKTEARNGKIFGRDVQDGVLVRFFIKHRDPIKKGDKITAYSPVKGIVSNVIDDELAPYSEFRPDEGIDNLMAPGALLARKTPSAIIVMFGNKVIIELKRKIQQIWES